jgi:hypothetical protein
MSNPAYRTMGLSVPVTEALDPALWRERYAYGITLGVGEPSAETAALKDVLGCDTSRGHPKTAGGRALKAETADDCISALATEIPPSVIRWHLRAAMSELEIKLGIPFGVVVTKGIPVDDGLVQGTDYDRAEPRRVFLESERRAFYRVDLPASVLSVERVRAFWFDQLVWSISADDNNQALIQLEHPSTGSMHLLPTQAATLLIAMPISSSPEYGSLQMMMGYPSQLPGVWSIDYTQGPMTKQGQPGHIEAALAHWIYCKAGILLLSMGGMAASKGLTNASLSIDGLMKSIGLQASAMYGINSALENRLKEAEEAIDWNKLRLYKRGMRIRPYGA